MKLDHLTFEQLYRLAHTETLIRVTRVYHSRLRKGWDLDNSSLTMEPFYVRAAECLCPEIARRYRRVLDFLRGPELKAALRHAAAGQEIPHMPGAALALCQIPQRSPQLMRAHANIIYTFVKLSGGVPIVWEDTETGVLRVLVDTTDLGIAILTHRPGLKWRTIRHECALENTFPVSIFWWVNLIPRLQDDDRVNPSVWPCNTPDVAATAESLVTRAS